MSDAKAAVGKRKKDDASDDDESDDDDSDDDSDGALVPIADSVSFFSDRMVVYVIVV
jgi:hypothetical protein